MKLDLWDFLFNFSFIFILISFYFGKQRIFTTAVSIIYILLSFYFGQDLGINPKTLIYLTSFWALHWFMVRYDNLFKIETEEYNKCLKFLRNNVLKLKDVLDELKFDEKSLKRGYEKELETAEILRAMSRAMEFENVFDIFSSKIQNIGSFDNCIFILAKNLGGNPEVFKNYFYRSENIELSGLISKSDFCYESDFYKVYQKEHHNKIVLYSGKFDECYPIIIFKKISDMSFENIKPLLTPFYLEIKKSYYFEKIKNLSIIDGLTNLYHRRYFISALEEELIRTGINLKPFSVLMMDIDDFKKYNDKYGHLAGDFILKEIGEIILNTVRKNDIVSRYGGEEFIFLLSNTDRKAALSMAGRLLKAICLHKFAFSGNEFNITVSIGISVYPESGLKSCEDIIALADKNLYLAKTSGKNRFYI